MTPPGKLLGPNGRPISTGDFQNKKATPPRTGEAFGQWAGRDVQFATLPGGGVVQFDLSQLTLSDFRSMRDHYQVNASLAVLTFMQHQSEWRIECSDKKIGEAASEQLANIWTPLNRSMGTANWAGFTPNALNWDNDINKRQVVIDKVKDLIPEECTVNWKLVDGYAPPDHVPPRFKVYDGIKQGMSNMWWDDEGVLRRGPSQPIPVENSFWYPLLMENGDYYGRKLLRPAFTSWFFSILVHLFANRYYERFGEPTPIGRAPFDEEFPDAEGSALNGLPGNLAMLEILKNLRNRGVVTLPNSRTPTGVGDATEFDYQIEYLESQMRGADFERYMTRLDEEISIGLFTPILLLRTADVGSYNLGVGHMQMYLWMLNAMNGDRKYYIDKYLLRPFVNYNFSENAPDAKIVFKKLGDQNSDMIRDILKVLMTKDKIKPDIDQLGEMAGLTLKEVRAVTKPAPAPGDPNADPNADPNQPAGGGTDPNATGAAGSGTNSAARIPREVHAVAEDIIRRVGPQVDNAFREGTFGEGLDLNLGFKHKMEKAIDSDGFSNSIALATRMYNRMDLWIEDIASLGTASVGGPEVFMTLFKRVLRAECDDLPNVNLQ